MQVGKILMYVVTFVMSAHSTITNMTMMVPQCALKGSTVTLQCNYDKSTPRIYLRWYKNDLQIYPLMPQEMVTFDVLGAELSLAGNDPRQIVLSTLQPRATGLYKCEASENMRFSSPSVKMAFMSVLDVPSHGPIAEYSQKDGRIMATCTSPPSYPSMNITWIAMNKIIKHPNVHTTTNSRNNCVQITRSEIEISNWIYRVGAFKLRCVATLFDLYKGETELFVPDLYRVERLLKPVETPYTENYYPQQTLEIKFVIYFSIVVIVMVALYGLALYRW